MSGHDTISTIVDKAIKAAHLKKKNNKLLSRDRKKLMSMSNEIKDKISEFEKEKNKIDMCLDGGVEHESYSC